MAYRADPGGIFDSDAHRRVLGHLPLPGDEPQEQQAFLDRIRPDQHTPLSDDEVLEVLGELADANDASESAKGWRMTKQGFDKITGPIADEPPPVPA